MGITQERLRELFSYREDGFLVRKVSRSANAQVGSVAGGMGDNGYRLLNVDDKRYRYHRLIYLWHHGEMPEFVDHIDRCRLNNRIENLRAATRVQQNANRSLNKLNTPEFKGVRRLRSGQTWRAYISVKNKTIHLGCFPTPEAAAAAYDQAAVAIHGEFACTNADLRRGDI